MQLSCARSAPPMSGTGTHRITFIQTQPDVRIEVLDWGGSGPAVVFLAGFGDSGHVFDNFAPRFTAGHHVIGITRRGFGASSKPTSGYRTAVLVDDILAVLDSLHIPRATFIGHSFGGTELSYLGAVHADRVEKLVYLDASYDFQRLYSDTAWKRAFPVPRPTGPTSGDTAELRRYFTLTTGPHMPDDELRVLTSIVVPDSLSAILQRDVAPVDFRAITPPILALWAQPTSVEQSYPYFNALDSSDRARLQASFERQLAVRETHLAEFRAQARHARVVSIAGGRHFLFLSHPDDVARLITEFLQQ